MVQKAEDFLRDLDYSVVQQCIHCGMCLPTCPTYVDTRRERHSPRGRIALMRAVADGELEADRAFAEEMNYCLGCLACVSACPAGVDYGHLIERARAAGEASGTLDSPSRRFWRRLALDGIFRHPRRLRLLGKAMWLYQASGLEALGRRLGAPSLLPERWQKLEAMAPRARRRHSDQLIAETERPAGPVRFRVGVLTGCAQDILLSEVNRDTVDILLANGCETVVPREQSCCGSLFGHNGDLEGAKAMARRLIGRFDLDSLDAVVTNAAGCGSHLKHFGRLLADDPGWAGRARLWDAKARDVSEWLVEIGLRTPAPGPAFPRRRVVYHEACHLCHGQGISRQPKELLGLVPGLELAPLEDATWCCGSAGVYNIVHPDYSDTLLERKVDTIERASPDAVSAANPGCHFQIERGLRRRGLTVEVRHPASLLAEAYRAEAGVRYPAGSDRFHHG